MKGFKKLLTGILAATMVMGASMSMTVYAEEENTTQQEQSAQSNGSITVKGTEDGRQYAFYKVFDVKANDTNTAFSYEINSDWSAFFTGAGSSYIVDSNSGNLSPILINGAVKYINITDSNVVAFTNAAHEYALGKSAVKTITGDGSDMTVSFDSLGYYLMIPVLKDGEGEIIQNANSSGSIASIDTNVPNAEIVVKADTIVIQKKDNKISVDLGEEVDYEITSIVPGTEGFNDYKYLITDTMTDGLDLVADSIVVSIDGQAISDATITPQAHSFTVDIPVVNYRTKTGKQIKVTYKATVNANAVVKSQEVNTVKLTYGHNPTDTVDYNEEVYSTKIVISKVDANNKETKLAGAKFALMKVENGSTLFYNVKNVNGKDVVEWVSIDGVSINPENVVDDATVTKINAATTITMKTTDTNGAAEFIGLKDGTYYLVEVEAPAGYNRLDKVKMAQFAGTDVDNETHLEYLAYADTSYDANYSPEGYPVVVENNSGALLPSTGGIGTTIFYIVGGILIIAGVAYFILRRKTNAD